MEGNKNENQLFGVLCEELNAKKAKHKEELGDLLISTIRRITEKPELDIEELKLVPEIARELNKLFNLD